MVQSSRMIQLPQQQRTKISSIIFVFPILLNAMCAAHDLHFTWHNHCHTWQQYSHVSKFSFTSSLVLINVRTMFQVRTERNALTAIGVTWIVILLVSLPVYVSHGEVTYTYSSAEHTACVFLEYDPVNRPDGYNKPIYQVQLHKATCRVNRVAGNPVSLINTCTIQSFNDI